MSFGYFQLPPSWEWIRVRDAGFVQLGRQKSPEHHYGEHLRPYLRVANVFENRIDTSDILQMNFTPAEAERYMISPGDILLNEGQSRELVGRPAMFRNEVPGACFQNTLLRFRAFDNMTEPTYALSVFRWYLRAGFFQKICKWTTNIAHLGAERFAEMPFPLAPLPEQKRIADKLDRLLARVDACRERLDRVPALLKRFRQSVLAAATSGELTREWREATGRSMSWVDVTLKDIADITGGVTKDSKKESSQDEEVPYLRVANVQRGYLDLTEVKAIRVPSAKLQDLLLEPGDVLFNEGGDIDKLGRGWVWEGQISRCTFQNHVFRARLRDKGIQPKYISWWGNSRGLDYFLRNGKQTTNLASINKSMLSALPISLPPADEQKEIVRRVESLFALAEKVESRYRALIGQVHHLTPATLARAFRGELVPQDPADEPAAALLARISAAREDAGASAGPRRRKTTPESRA